MDKKFLTEEEAISQFGLDAGQFQQVVEDGKLRTLPDRGTLKFRRDEIEGLIQQGDLIADSPGGDAPSDEGLKIGAGPNDFSFLELDEDALAEGATMVKKSSDLAPPDEAALLAVSEMTGDSSSEVTLVEGSGAEHRAAENFPDVESSMPVIIAADHSIVADSDSDVKIMEGAAQRGLDRNDVTDPMLAATAPATIEPASDADGSDSDVRIADSGISLEAPDSGLAFESSGILGGGSGLRTHESGVTLRPVDSGISLESDSGLTLESSAVDSGLTLESQPDSGLTLESQPDSGLTLEATDSGIRLEPDSGIKLEDDSAVAAPAHRHSRADDTQPEFEVADEEFAMDDSSASERTAMIALDDDDALETLAPTRRPGKQAPSLSESFDSADEVEDLEIADDLDAGELDVDSVDEEDDLVEDVLEASDDAFSMSEAGELSEEAISEASVPVVKTARREPAWGILAILPVAAAALLLAVNTLMLWDGMATMWNGDTGKALSTGIIDVLAGLI